jgi:hypothetical protein
MSKNYSALRYIPAGAQVVEYQEIPAVIVLSESSKSGKPYAIGYRGKAGKPSFNYSFRSLEERERYVSEWLKNQLAWNERKAAQRAERSKPHTLAVGDVLVSSWGYDQTNIDYYEVVRVVGPSSVEIQQISQSVVGESGGPSEKVVPNKGSYIGAPMLKRANSTNSVHLTSYSSASPWSGQPRHQTGYGWGH